MSEPVANALEIAASLCRPFEGLRLTPYLCPAGVWTIGYGSIFKPDGTSVTQHDAPITKETAEEWMMHELQTVHLPGVLRASPSLAANPRVLGALTDFAYNLGVGRYRASTLKKRVDEQDWAGAKEQIMRWVYGGGRVLPGLVRRRQAESLFLD